MVLPSSSSSSGWLTLSHPLPPPSLFGGAAAAAKTAMSRVLPRVVMCLFYDGDMTGPRCCPIRDCRLTTSHAKRTKFEEHTHSAGPRRHIYIYMGWCTRWVPCCRRGGRPRRRWWWWSTPQREQHQQQQHSEFRHRTIHQFPDVERIDTYRASSSYPGTR